MSTNHFDEAEFVRKLYEALVKKAEEFGGSATRVNEKIEAKIRELDGFITRSGAIALIAKEEGLSVSMDTEPSAAPTELPTVQLAELPKSIGHRINIRCSLVYKGDYEVITTKKGSQVARMNIRIEDATGKAWITLWADHAKQLRDIDVPAKLLIEAIKVDDSEKYGLKLKAWRGQTHFHLL